MALRGGEGNSYDILTGMLMLLSVIGESQNSVNVT